MGSWREESGSHEIDLVERRGEKGNEMGERIITLQRGIVFVHSSIVGKPYWYEEMLDGRSLENSLTTVIIFTL